MAPVFDSAHDCLHSCARYLEGSLAHVWIYHDRDGVPVAAVGRIETDQGKTYRPAHRTRDGGWTLGGPVDQWPLYNLNDLRDHTLVVVVEGEKCCELLRAIGVVAVTSAHGAGAAHKTDWSPLAGRTVALIADHDENGQQYMLTVAAILSTLGCTVFFCDLPGQRPGDDIEQWLQRFPDHATPEAKAGALLALLLSCQDHQGPPPPAPPPPDDRDRPDPDKGIDQPQTEAGTAALLVRWYGTNIIHICNWDQFCYWDGTRWDTDHNQNYVSQRALDTVRRRTIDPKWRRSAESDRGLNAIVKRAAHHPDLAVIHHRLDQDPWALNCTNGTIDLRTGRLRPHHRRDLITTLCPTPYDPSNTCPLWRSSLDLIFGGDQDLIDYVQRLFGYCLTGSTQEQIFPIFYGSGENGKSTILNCFLGLLGRDLAMKAPRNFLMKRNGEVHPTELADLCGKRMVVAMETAQGQAIDEPMVKEATGGDPIRARRMRENFWEFLPVHKIIQCTNHKPRIEGEDHAIWRRIMLIPFLIRIPAERKDPRFPEKLALERPGVLAWAVQGCLDWLERGTLDPPRSVLASTTEYRSEEDMIGSFLTDECVVSLPGSRDSVIKAPATELYKRYCKWCESHGETPFTQREFGKRMTERGVARYRNNMTWYGGVGLRADER